MPGVTPFQPGRLASAKVADAVGGTCPLPTVAEVIEDIGFGWAQVRAILLGGCVWLADGSELLLIGTVTRAVSDEWGMRAWQRGSVVSVVFVGIFLGNSICGPLGDHLGRRLPILLSYAGIAVFSMLSALTQDFYQLALVRILVGMSFGIGQPACNALSSEVSPRNWRIFMNALAQGLFFVGELYSACLVYWDDPYMKRLDWRWLLMMGAIPSAICFVLAVPLLQQSPQFLAIRGDHDGAIAVLARMRDDNRAAGVSVDITRSEPRISSSAGRPFAPVAVIFSRRLAYSTLAVIYTTFTLNVVFYGCLYAFPQVVADVDMNATPATSLIIGALWELPGTILATICGIYWPRIPVIAGYLVTTGLSLFAFGIGASMRSSAQEDDLASSVLHGVLLHGGYVGIKVFAIVGFVAVYQYSTEIYPTVARTTGTAACVAGGRIGGMVAPLIFEWLLEATGSISAFFFFVGTLCGTNLVLVAFLPFETFGRSLEDHADEVRPIVAAAA